MNPDSSAARTATDFALLALTDAAVKSAVLLVLAMVVAWCCRKASAAKKHALWCGALAGALILPILSFALPEWRVPWLPEWRPAAMIAAPVAKPPVPSAPIAEVKKAQPSNADTAAETVGASLAASPESSASVQETKQPGISAFVTTVPTPSAIPSHPAAPIIPIFPVALFFGHWAGPLWLLGAWLALLPMLAGWMQAAWLTRRARHLDDPEWNALLAETLRALDLRRTVRLLAAPRMTMPFTWGAWRVVVLFPESVAAWPEARRRLVLIHELGHIKRWDWLTQTLGTFACALYWFNPLAWMAARQMRLEREQACDDLVLRCGPPPQDYARELLELAAHASRNRLLNWAAVPMARRSTLEDRLRAILDGKRNRATLNRAVALGILAVVAAIAIPIAMLRAAAPAEAVPTSSNGSTPQRQTETARTQIAAVQEAPAATASATAQPPMPFDPQTEPAPFAAIRWLTANDPSSATDAESILLYRVREGTLDYIEKLPSAAQWANTLPGQATGAPVGRGLTVPLPLATAGPDYMLLPNANGKATLTFLPNVQDYTSALQLDPGIVLTGNYGYWVSDEAMKAKNALVSPRIVIINSANNGGRIVPNISLAPAPAAPKPQLRPLAGNPSVVPVPPPPPAPPQSSNMFAAPVTENTVTATADSPGRHPVTVRVFSQLGAKISTKYEDQLEEVVARSAPAPGPSPAYLSRFSLPDPNDTEAEIPQVDIKLDSPESIQVIADDGMKLGYDPQVFVYPESEQRPEKPNFTQDPASTMSVMSQPKVVNPTVTPSYYYYLNEMNFNYKIQPPGSGPNPTGMPDAIGAAMILGTRGIVSGTVPLSAATKYVVEVVQTIFEAPNSPDSDFDLPTGPRHTLWIRTLKTTFVAPAVIAATASPSPPPAPISAPLSPGFPAPPNIATTDAAPTRQIKAEALLLEWPESADFKLNPPADADLKKFAASLPATVKVISNPVILTTNGKEITIFTGSSGFPWSDDSNPTGNPGSTNPGTTLKLLPTATGDEVSYSLHLSYVKAASGAQGQGNTAPAVDASEITTSGHAKAGQPVKIDLDPSPAGLKRAVVMVFTVIDPGNTVAPTTSAPARHPVVLPVYSRPEVKISAPGETGVGGWIMGNVTFTPAGPASAAPVTVPMGPTLGINFSSEHVEVEAGYNMQVGLTPQMFIYPDSETRPAKPVFSETVPAGGITANLGFQYQINPSGSGPGTNDAAVTQGATITSGSGATTFGTLTLKPETKYVIELVQSVFETPNSPDARQFSSGPRQELWTRTLKTTFVTPAAIATPAALANPPQPESPPSDPATAVAPPPPAPAPIPAAALATTAVQSSANTTVIPVVVAPAPPVLRPGMILPPPAQNSTSSSSSPTNPSGLKPGLLATPTASATDPAVVSDIPKSRTLPSIPGTLAREETFAQWQSALATPNGVRSDAFLNAIMNHLNPADLPYLVQQVANLPASADRDFAVAQLLLMMDAWEPVTALSLTGNIIDPHERWDTVCSIFRTMASHVHGTGTPDPTPLFNELDGLLPGPHAQFVYHNNFQTLAGENPSFGPAAAALAFALPPGAERTQALRGVATGWSKYDSQAALAWATSLPPADSAAIRDAIVPPPPTQNSTSSSSPTMNPSGFTPAVLESKGKSMPVLMGPRTITVAPSPDVQVEENAAAPPAATP